MGGIQSKLRNIYLGLKAIFQELSTLSEAYSGLQSRISTSPGLPVPSPTTPFWTQHPPFPKLCQIQSPVLTSSADVVIIGSGITAAAVAKTILDECAALKVNKKVVILEARELCSGATGRNGGHIKCTPHDAYAMARKSLGVQDAKKVVEFQMRHLDLLLELAKAEGWEKAEVREVETVDLFFHTSSWERGREMLEMLSKEWPEMAEGIKVWDREQAVEHFACSSSICGAMSYRAGALWPYRLVTSCFNSLLSKYPDFLSIETNTPAISIKTSSASSHPFTINHPITVATPRGHISTTHVVHATNSHASYLLPGLLSKLFSVRGHMSAQVPGTSMSKLSGKRSWSFINASGFEYITQRPGTVSSEEIGAEMMCGGGLFQSAGRGIDEIGVTTDAELEHMVASHVSGVLPMAFGSENWGGERDGRRIKSLWSGTMGFTADGMPIVGRLDPSITKRKLGAGRKTAGEVSPGEWISSACNGEGMVHAWLCGVALGLQLLGRDGVDAKASPGRVAGRVDDWLPKEFLVSEKRVNDMHISQLALE